LEFKREGPGMFTMAMAPCPFLSNQGRCLVHEYRPYNCRRFMCGRVNVQAESYETGDTGGCLNFADRMETSRRFAEFFWSAERRIQKTWALNHGWKQESL
jgi:Fe-S-cluster containining protein